MKSKLGLVLVVFGFALSMASCKPKTTEATTEVKADSVVVDSAKMAADTVASAKDTVVVK